MSVKLAGGQFPNGKRKMAFSRVVYERFCCCCSGGRVAGLQFTFRTKEYRLDRARIRSLISNSTQVENLQLLQLFSFFRVLVPRKKRSKCFFPTSNLMNASFRVCVVFFTPWNDIKQRHAHPIIIEYNKKNKYIEIISGRFSHFDSFLLKKKRHERSVISGEREKD